MLRGKIEIHNRVSIQRASFEGKENDTLGLIYTPGVAFVAKQISLDKRLAYDYTSNGIMLPLFAMERVYLG